MSPNDCATGVNGLANVTAGFNEAMAGVDTTTYTLRVTATGVTVPAAITRSGTTNKWILNPTDTLEPNTRYTVTLTGGPTAIRDVAGNPLASTTWTFTTRA